MAEPSLNFVHQRIRPESKLVILAILSVVLMILDNRYAPLQQIKTHIATALYPLQWLARKPVAWVENGLAYTQQQHRLLSENQALRAENTRLKLHVSQQTAQIQTLGGLAAVQQLQQSALPRAILAQVVTTGNSPLPDKVLIDSGSRQGIRLGDPVADEHGLIGQVSALQPLAAEVSLLTNSEMVVPAMVARTGVRTLVYGRPGGLDLHYFPADASLKAGDLLVTSGLDSIYPAGIPIAEVLSAQAGNGSPYYRAELRTAADNRRSRFVLVVPQQTPTTADTEPPLP